MFAPDNGCVKLPVAFHVSDREAKYCRILSALHDPLRTNPVSAHPRRCGQFGCFTAAWQTERDLQNNSVVFHFAPFGVCDSNDLALEPPRRILPCFVTYN
jgi:hypothetical protein